MNFAAGSSVLTPNGTAVSIARALHRGEMDVSISESDGHVATWWGGLLKVHKGDRILHFPTVVGVAVESVEPAA